MAILSGKIAEVIFEEALEVIQDQTMVADMCDRYEPEAGTMQNSGNVVWRPVEQQAVIQNGWDMTGLETSIIEETYPATLQDPKNDFVSQRADDMRDLDFWKKRGARSGKQQIVEQNTTIAQAIAQQGSQFYSSAATSGFDFISEAQAILNEEQRAHMQRCFILNDRDNQTFAGDLAGRQTLQGRPSDTWANGQIGSNVAEFDLFTGSFLPTIAGGAASTTVTGLQSFKPEGGAIDATGSIVTNVDYRNATIPVAASAGFAIGDKVTFSGVNAIGVSDKTSTARLRTFTIKAIPSGTSVIVSPKPIALDDPSLTVIEAAYANVDTQIVGAATMDRVNTAALDKTNLFFDKDAVEILSGTIPADLFSEFNGSKVLTETMPNGQKMYMVYDGDIATMTFRYRLFTWWGVTIKDPQRCGVAVTA
jgi:hypothetical protein